MCERLAINPSGCSFWLQKATKCLLISSRSSECQTDTMKVKAMLSCLHEITERHTMSEVSTNTAFLRFASVASCANHFQLP